MNEITFVPTVCETCSLASPFNDTYVRCGWSAPVPPWIVGWVDGCVGEAARLRPRQQAEFIKNNDCAAKQPRHSGAEVAA